LFIHGELADQTQSTIASPTSDAPISSKSKPPFVTVWDATGQLNGTHDCIRRHTCHIDAISVEDGRLAVGPRGFCLEGKGFDRLCRRLGAPPDYLRTHLTQELRDQLLRHHIENGALRRANHKAEIIAVLTREDRFLAFDEPDLFIVPGDQVLQAVCDGIGLNADHLQARNLKLTDESLQLDILAFDAEKEVRVGDTIEAGIRLTHSLIGIHATWIETYVYRLICKNGMVHRSCPTQGGRTRRLSINQHPDAEQLQIQQISSLAAKAWASLEQKVRLIQESQNKNIGDVRRHLRRCLQRARIFSNRRLEQLIELWEDEDERGGRGEQTAYGILNALTSAATHWNVSPRIARSLSQLAGNLAFEDLHICPRCFSVVES